MPTPLFSDAPKRQPSHGLCPACGVLAGLDDDGRIGWHPQMRVRRGRNGKPEEYRTGDDCDGQGCEPEQVA